MFYRRLVLLALTAGLISVPQVSAQNYAHSAGRRADFSKLAIETPLEKLISRSNRGVVSGSPALPLSPSMANLSEPAADAAENRIINSRVWQSSFARQRKQKGASSGSVELSTRNVLQDTGARNSDTRAGVKVAPGEVAWQPDFDTACKRASESGKPVLLFQMMGKLDDEFC
ncbi:MAG: hypothetical protein K2W95_15175 [Candidatus Obscuribacterales bacterium]|nr:hypothetical protein [Candidatus Obscuribacterales bacterium]